MHRTVCYYELMRVLGLEESLAVFDTFFASAQIEMFKAEVLQDYSTIDNSPSLRAWLIGDKEKSKELGRADAGIASWRKACLESPANITRVHATTSPYSPYLEWEIEIIYKGSLMPSGAETVYLAPLSKFTATHLPDGDFWIFDNKKALQWKYGKNGKLLGSKTWEESDDIAELLKLRQNLLAAAEPIK